MIKVLPVPTEVKGLEISNSRFPKAWETVEKFNKARKNGYCIEALSLSINILKYYLSITIEMYLEQQKTKKNKIRKILKKEKDVKELANYTRQVEIFTTSESRKIKNYWNKRNEVLHNFINGVIEYENVCSELRDHFEICNLVFKKSFDIKICPKETHEGQIRQKITFSPKVVIGKNK